MSRFRIAAAQYPVEALADWAAYEAKLTRWFNDAADSCANLAVFPEYGAMELASLDPASMDDLAGSMAFVSSLLPRVDALHAELARRYGLHVLAASAPCRLVDGRFVNRARLFAPGGGRGHQDKLMMTRFEREQWGVAGCSELHLFDTALGRVGVMICYDCEFPLIARALAEAGADLLLVPSCTDTLQGYWRVRVGAQARALENQCHVVHAPTVGEAAWSPAVDGNRGAAAVYAPPDGDFAADGVLAIGRLDAPQWLFADIDLAAARAVRADGKVLNHRDWSEQPGAGPLPKVSVLDLRQTVTSPMRAAPKGQRESC